MRTETSLKEKVKKIIAEDLCLDYDEVVDEASLEGTLGADSLDTLEITMTCENVFDIAISDDEARGVVTVKDVVNLVQGKVKVQ